MHKRAVARLWAILTSHGTEWSELQAGTLMAVWGVWLVLFNPFSSTAAVLYSAMARQAPDEIWGTGFLILGSTTLYGLAYDKWRIREIASMASFAWWFFIFLQYASVNYTLFAVPVSLVFALSSAWCHARLVALRQLPQHGHERANKR